jgi:DNA-binding NarL/FixJ family response regulator
LSSFGFSKQFQRANSQNPAFESAALVSEVIVAAADGYVLKLCPLQELLEAIRAMLRDEPQYP